MSTEEMRIAGAVCKNPYGAASRRRDGDRSRAHRGRRVGTPDHTAGPGPRSTPGDLAGRPGSAIGR